MLQQSFPGKLSHALDVQQLAVPIANLASLTVISHRKSVSFVSNLLYQVKCWRVPVKHDWIVFLPVEIEDLFSLGDRCQWLVRNSQRFERLCCRVQLAYAAVDQDQ